MHRVSLRDLEASPKPPSKLSLVVSSPALDEKTYLLASPTEFSSNSQTPKVNGKLYKNYGSVRSLATTVNSSNTLSSVSANSSCNNLTMAAAEVTARRLHYQIDRDDDEEDYDEEAHHRHAQLRVSLIPRGREDQLVMPVVPSSNGVSPIVEVDAVIGNSAISPSRVFGFIMVVFFVVALGFNHWQIASLADNPSVGPAASVLHSLGAKNADKIRDGQLWRLVTSLFLHCGLLQLAVNLYLLQKAATILEAQYGYLKFVVLFLISGISGYLVSSSLDPYSLSAGAAPAICGLYGGVLVHTYQHWSLIEKPGSLVALYTTELAMEVVCCIFPMNDITAVFGGLICGVIASIVLLQPDEPLKYYGSQVRVRKYYVFLVAQTMLVIWFAVWMWMATKHDPQWAAECQTCKNIGCVSSPLWSCSIGHCIQNGTLQVHLGNCPEFASS
jgi:membrane associated rhomboid family serine protease